MVNFEDDRKQKGDNGASTPKIPMLDLNKLNKQQIIAAEETGSQRSIFDRNSFREF